MIHPAFKKLIIALMVAVLIIMLLVFLFILVEALNNWLKLELKPERIKLGLVAKDEPENLSQRKNKRATGVGLEEN